MDRLRGFRPRFKRASIAIAIIATVASLSLAGSAFAYDETTGYPVPLGHSSDYYACTNCHGYATASQDCYDCHGPGGGFADSVQFGKGPHAGYTTGSQRCGICHTLHAAGSNFALLPKPTIKETCETCHDGTGGKDVYGAIQARTSVAPGQQHRVDVTRKVPGGDAATGGSIDTSFTGPGGTLTCTDCHNPHNSDTVTAFPGERRRVPYSVVSREAWQSLNTNRLLSRHPGGTTQAVDVYGSDWCLACHKGRMQGGAVSNHPVDARVLRADAFKYSNVAIADSDNLTTKTVLGALAGTNRGYLMYEPRTTQQGTHMPICQQCHEDSRNVGSLTASGTDPATFTVSVDGTDTASNPRFQNFPHETQNQHLLVETGDSLCLNCHIPSNLP